jgi:hypothetical protein
MVEVAAQNLLAALRGETPPNLLNPKALPSPQYQSRARK